MSNIIRVEGVAEVIAALRDHSPRIARNLLRSTVQGVASQAAKEVKAGAPVLEGELKKSIKATRKKSKAGGNLISSAVTISAKTGGDNSRPDGVYKWVHVEYGTQTADAVQFVEPVANRVRAELPRILTEQFSKKLAALIARQMRAGL